MTKRTFIILIILLLIQRLPAVPIIDSISTVQGTCRDNGTIRIYAHSTTPLHYAIIAGPQIRLPQLSSIFTALPVGVYTVQISDGASSLARSATVTGYYQYFDFSPQVIYPQCLRDSGIVLIGHPDSGAISYPLSWQLTAPDGQVRPAQQSDTFAVTTAGTYTLRCIDACGTVRQRYYTIPRTANANLVLQYKGNEDRKRCDSMGFYAQFDIIGGLDHLGFPLSFIEYNTHGDTVHADFATNPGIGVAPLPDGLLRFYTGEVIVESVMGGLRTGDSIYFGFIDACGDTVISSIGVPGPEIHMSGWTDISAVPCSHLYVPYINYFLPRPNQWILIDDATQAIVDSSSMGYYIQPHPAGRSYTFICFDQCGDTLRLQFTWQPPAPQAAYVTPYIDQSSCLDSTATVTFDIYNFNGATQIRVLSGPTYAQSSKPGFSYRSHISYPYIFNEYAPGVTGFADFPPGYYTYEVDDSCGDHVAGAFYIGPEQVTNFTHHLTASRNCPGGNSIVYQYGTGAAQGAINIYYTTYNAATGQKIDSSYIYGNGGIATINNLAPGTYVIRLEMQSGIATIIDSAHCSMVYDTVVIPPYTFPDMPVVTYSPSCTGYATISAEMDTALGVPGYTYQIIAGPEVSAVQYSSGAFQVSHTGIYTILGLDQCGNGLVRNVSVDSLYLSVSTTSATTDSCFRTHVRGTLYTESSIVIDTLRTAAGCDSVIRIDTIIIRGSYDRQPIIAFATDTFCAGAGGDISATIGYGIYQWDNGATTPIIHVSDSGWYHLTVTDTEGCTLSDQIYIALLDSPSVTSGWIYADSVCLDDPLYIQLTLSGPDVQYAWSDISDATLQRQFPDSGFYIFTVSNKCATKSYTLRTKEKTCDEQAYPPNAFSPNGDGVNDIYRIYSSYDFQSFSLLIFDRWGEKVFQSSTESNGWDGRYKNEDLPPGIYTYEYIGVWPTGHTHTSHGSITLIR